MWFFQTFTKKTVQLVAGAVDTKTAGEKQDHSSLDSNDVSNAFGLTTNHSYQPVFSCTEVFSLRHRHIRTKGLICFRRLVLLPIQPPNQPSRALG